MCIVGSLASIIETIGVELVIMNVVVETGQFHLSFLSSVSIQLKSKFSMSFAASWELLEF